MENELNQETTKLGFQRENQIGCFGLAMDLLNGECLTDFENEDLKAPLNTLQNHTSELAQEKTGESFPYPSQN